MARKIRGWPAAIAMLGTIGCAAIAEANAGAEATRERERGHRPVARWPVQFAARMPV